jgi:hypothetical protein
MKQTTIIAALVTACGLYTAQAETMETVFSEPKDMAIESRTQGDGKIHLLDELDLAVTGGSTGIGVELSTPIGNCVRVRVGYDFMPRFQKTLTFGVQMADNDYSRKLYETDREAYNQYMAERFDRISGKVNSLMGLELDNSIDMLAKPTMNHYKVLVDVLPFKNKHWHVTAGFYYSSSSTIGEALNSAHDATAPVGVGIYNTLIDKLNPMVSYDADWNEYCLNFNGNLLWYSTDEESSSTMYSLCAAAYNKEYMGVNMGTKIDENGNEVAYTLFPDADNSLSAKMKTRRFKPYLGFGYEGSLTKNKEEGWRIGFDCGVLFWGGKPCVITHDGTDLTHDVKNLRGQVKDYVNIAKAFVVYPAVSLRISKSLYTKKR